MIQSMKMSAGRWLVRCAAIACATATFASAQTAAPTNGQTLRKAAAGKMLVGCAVMSGMLDDPKIAELVATQFDCITPENEMKPIEVHPAKDQYTFANADKIVAFAQSHDMKLVGHNLVWHIQSPTFLYADEGGKPLSRDVALANMKEHITTVMQHFKGKLIGWDVVNEAIDDGPGYLRDTPAHRAIGDDYLIQAYKFAAAADPSAELYYNDYSNEDGEKLAKCLRLVKELKDAGCKVDAIGLQGHWQMQSPAAQAVDDAITEYSKLGVRVGITELDVDMLPRNNGGADVTATEKGGADPYKAGLPEDLAQRQAERYASLFAVFAKHPGTIERVTFWGTHDGTSWLNDFPVVGRTNHALLFARDLSPKPAFAAVVAALQATHAK